MYCLPIKCLRSHWELVMTPSCQHHQCVTWVFTLTLMHQWRRTFWEPCPLSYCVRSAAFVNQSHSRLQSLVVSLVLTCLDHGNGTLASVASSQLNRLQSVTNAAARLVCSARKCDHNTPLLLDLHWLCMPQRIKFKHVCFDARAEHSTNMSCHRRWLHLQSHCSSHLEQFAVWRHCVAITVHLQAMAEDVILQLFIWCMTEPRDTVVFNFLLLSALKVFWLYGSLITYVYNNNTS